MGRREYLRAIYDRYYRSSTEKKGVILDEFCRICGYHRKHAIRLLRGPRPEPYPRRRRGRGPGYGRPVLQALAQVWEAAGYPWSVRLKAMLPLWLPWLGKRMTLSAELKRQLLAISDRRGEHEAVAFDFLGYTFQPRRARNHRGKFFVSFLPAISAKAAKAIRKTVRDWRLAFSRNNQCLADLARLVNPAVRGWMNYYGWYYRSRCVQDLRHLNEALAAWARRKYARLRRRERASMHWLGRIAQRDPNLFVLWQLGIRPEAGGQEPDEARVSRPVR